MRPTPWPRLPRLLRAWLALTALALAQATTWAAPWLDDTPRIAVISAFPAELELLLQRVQGAQQHRVNGVTFTTGQLQGKPVVMLLSGISMTNAAMNTQLTLDRFKVTHIVYSGIAGGVNPGLHIGDVTVPQRWGQYLEVLVARETAAGVFTPPVWMDDVKLPRFGANHPRPVEVRSAAQPQVHKKFWFDVDPALLAVARGIQGTALSDCDAARKCLGHKPRVVVGGSGVSGPAFVDNAAFRDYTFKTFEANVLDMETAATAQVAYSNGIPYIAFRSLSDLAGGGPGENELETFFKIAADNSAAVLLAFLAAWK